MSERPVLEMKVRLLLQVYDVAKEMCVRKASLGDVSTIIATSV